MKRVFVIVASIWLTASAAFAGEVNFSQHIVDLDGHDIPSSPAKDAPPLDLAMVAGVALLTEPTDPRISQTRDPADKLKRFELALKVHGGGKIELAAEDITLLKSAIAQVYGPLVVGRAIEILDPAAIPK